MHPDKIERDPTLEPTEKDGKASKNLPRTSRREWFRTSAGGCAGLALGSLIDLPTVRASTQDLKLSEITSNLLLLFCGRIQAAVQTMRFG